LVEGGAFWALTVDARHWFCRASLWAERLRVKERYLSWLLGRRGGERYENYPVHYRCNTPEQVTHFARAFSSVTCVNLSREDQADGVLPRYFRPRARCWERRSIRRGKPGTILLVRAVK